MIHSDNGALAAYASIGSFGYAGWQAVKAQNQRCFVQSLQKAAGTALPKENGESVITAIELASRPSITAIELASRSLPFLPSSSEQEAFLGRISVTKNSTGYGWGYGVNTNLDFHISRLSITNEHTVLLGFPETASFQSRVGVVEAKNLKLATWYGQATKTQYLTPNEWECMRGTRGQEADFSANGYKVVSEWFKSKELTIFGQVTKRPEFFEINPIMDKNLFTVTPHTPTNFIQNQIALAAKYSGRAKAFSIAGLALACGAFVFEKQHEASREARRKEYGLKW